MGININKKLSTMKILGRVTFLVTRCKDSISHIMVSLKFLHASWDGINQLHTFKPELKRYSNIFLCKTIWMANGKALARPIRNRTYFKQFMIIRLNMIFLYILIAILIQTYALDARYWSPPNKQLSLVPNNLPKALLFAAKRFAQIFLITFD